MTTKKNTTKKSATKRVPKTGRRRRAGTQLGAALIESLSEAIAFKNGQNTGATVRTVTARRAAAAPAPRYTAAEIARLRRQLRLSQPVFADALNVSPAAVKAWEQGMNAPGGAALRLLQIVESHPEVILEQVGAR